VLIYTAFLLLCFFYVYIQDRGIDHPPLSLAEVENEICTPAPLYCCMACYGETLLCLY